jgi:ribosomal-protein-alanine N-acetyltransferase
MATAFRQQDGWTAAEQITWGAPVAATDWRTSLPVLTGTGVSLRELRMADAPALLELLSSAEVARFISPPPTTVEGFERFITWARSEQHAGRYLCFAVVPEGMDSAVGIFQVRQLEPTFETAEWGFALGRAFWGSGVFSTAARLVLGFTFDTVGVHRLEARAVVANGRGNGALAKLGAVKEGVLRRSFLRGGDYFDQALWSIVRDDWARTTADTRVSVH